MTDEPLSIGEQIRNIAEEFLRKMAPVIQQAQRVEDEMMTEQSHWAAERQTWAKERSLLRDSTLVAERREAAVQRELAEANDEIARLLAQLNIIQDATQRGQEGATIARRVSGGQSAFGSDVGPSLTVAGGHKGHAYQAVLADAQDNARAVENMAPEFLRALEKELANPQGA